MIWNNTLYEPYLDYSIMNYTYEDDPLLRTCETTIELIDTVFFFFCVAVVVIGVFGNTTGIIILLWARCRLANSLNVYLISVYVCDLGFLLCLSLQLANIGRVTLYSKQALSCEISVYVVNVLSFASQWSMWAISAERYLAVCHPMSLRYRRFSTVQSAFNVVLAVTVIGMILEIWVFFVVETDPSGECDLRANTSGLFDIFNLVDSFLSYALPGIMIGFFTFSMFRTLYDRRSTFRELDPSALINRSMDNRRSPQSYETVVVISRGASERAHRRERRAAWFLMSIVLIDTMLNVQNYTLRLFNTFYQPDVNYCVTYRVIQVLSYMLYYCQFAANVFYLIFCPITRRYISSSRKVSRPESASENNTRKKSSDSYFQRSKASFSYSPNSVHASLREHGNSCATPLMGQFRSVSNVSNTVEDDI